MSVSQNADTGMKLRQLEDVLTLDMACRALPKHRVHIQRQGPLGNRHMSRGAPASKTSTLCYWHVIKYLAERTTGPADAPADGRSSLG